MFYLRKKAVLWKRLGETPLQALERYRAWRPWYQGVPMTYAGRLDPMAEGKLLILIGDECKEREKYLGLDKVYEVEVLFGVGSDTGDILGIVEKGESIEIDEEKLAQELANLVGEIEMPYPTFSSKTVQGKPLFQWSLEKRLSEIEIPTRRSTIFDATLLSARTVSNTEIHSYITHRIGTLKPVLEESKKLGEDFRKDAVLESWKEVCEEERSYFVAKIKITCSSGTYMRSLAQRLGETFGTRALAFSITRTWIGEVRKRDAR